jgi:choline-glycine betaine transporter
MFFWMMVLVYIIVQRPSPTLRRFAWGVSGGSVTGFQNFLKDSLTIIKAVGEKDEAFPWYFYIMVILGIASSFGGLLFLTACMKRYDATFSSAMFVGSFVISASIMAAVHYQTFEHLENLSNYIMYPFGLIVLMIGVAMLVQATSEQDIEFDTGTDDQNDFQSDAHDYTNINAENSGSSNDMVSKYMSCSNY